MSSPDLKVSKRERRKAVAGREIFISDARRPGAATWADILSIRHRWRTVFSDGVEDVTTRYRRSVLGPFWNLVSTVVFVLGFMALGKLLLNIPAAEFREYVAYVTGGVVLWSFIFSILVEGANMYTTPVTTGFQLSFAEIPFRILVRNYVMLAFNLATLFLVALLFIGPNISMFMVIPGLILMGFVLLPAGIVLGIMAARMRDLGPAVSNLMQFGFYLSPVFWRARDIPETYPERLFLELNPFYYMLTLARDPLMGNIPSAKIYIVSAALGIVAWIIAIIVFAKYRRKLTYWS